MKQKKSQVLVSNQRPGYLWADDLPTELPWDTSQTQAGVLVLLQMVDQCPINNIEYLPVSMTEITLMLYIMSLS